MKFLSSIRMFMTCMNVLVRYIFFISMMNRSGYEENSIKIWFTIGLMTFSLVIWLMMEPPTTATYCLVWQDCSDDGSSLLRSMSRSMYFRSLVSQCGFILLLPCLGTFHMKIRSFLLICKN